MVRTGYCQTASGAWYTCRMADLPKTEQEWKEKLGEEKYRVLRQRGTEAPFSGALLHEKRTGMYRCAACGNELFSSDTKFDSGSGWPSFDQAIPGSIKLTQDNSHSMNRTEVTCAHCGSHLGHVFDDGPTETGKRYCLNSVCLDFQEQNKEQDEFTG